MADVLSRRIPRQGTVRSPQQQVAARAMPRRLAAGSGGRRSRRVPVGVRATAVAVALLLPAAACGGAGDTEVAPDPAPAAAPAPVTQADVDPPPVEPQPLPAPPAEPAALPPPPEPPPSEPAVAPEPPPQPQPGPSASADASTPPEADDPPAAPAPDPPAPPPAAQDDARDPDSTAPGRRPAVPDEALPAPEPPAPPAPVPDDTTPGRDQANILIAKETVNGVVPVYDAPGGERVTFRDGDVWSYTYRGNRLVARVVQGEPGDEWVQVELPVRPNGSRGWVRAEHFNWSTVAHRIVIDVSDRRVTLFDGERVVATTRAIVGKAATPTPSLSGFLVEKLPNHSQQNASVVLGDWILMFSFFSEALDTFSGGLPRIALHGTHIPERVGEALSNGCIRIPNEVIEIIAQRAPLGTIVEITA